MRRCAARPVSRARAALPAAPSAGPGRTAAPRAGWFRPRRAPRPAGATSAFATRNSAHSGASRAAGISVTASPASQAAARNWPRWAASLARVARHRPGCRSRRLRRTPRFLGQPQRLARMPLWLDRLGRCNEGCAISTFAHRGDASYPSRRVRSTATGSPAISSTQPASWAHVSQSSLPRTVEYGLGSQAGGGGAGEASSATLAALTGRCATCDAGS